MDKIGKLLETIRRLKAERPQYFKWLGNWTWVLTLISGALLVLSISGVYTAPDWMDSLLTALTSLFGGAAATTLVAVKDKQAAGVPEDEPVEGGPGPGGRPPGRP